MRRLMAFVFGNNHRAVTPFDVEPASAPNSHKESQLQRGRELLDHYVASAERTVATSQQSMAALAADALRR